VEPFAEPLFDLPSRPGFVASPTVEFFPDGYVVGVTRYADIILAHAFSGLWADLLDAFDELTIARHELEVSGGNRTPIAQRFDASLERRGWGKRTIEIEKHIDRVPYMGVRGHEIDMFKSSVGAAYPGVGCEMEWNNKDPFFDRDLNNFAALHREGVVAVGVIVTRGPRLQSRLQAQRVGGPSKYGASTTWWDKLLPRVDLGGGGECPLLLVGIEPARVSGLA
jgi:Restriction endonuclease BglII